LAAEPRPIRIAQVSDIHCGSTLFEEELLRSTVERVKAMEPDVVVVAGDLTAEGYPWEYEEAATWLDGLESRLLVIIGNHDARNLGYLHFERIYGDRFPTMHFDFDGHRAGEMGVDGLTIVGVDSSEPDKNAGRIGPRSSGTSRTPITSRSSFSTIISYRSPARAASGARWRTPAMSSISSPDWRWTSSSPGTSTCPSSGGSTEC